MNARRVLPLLLAFALAPSFAGCKRNGGGKSGAPRVGIITALTGTHAAFGLAHQRGYAIALEEINADGGVLSEPLELDIYDDQSKPDVALQGVSKLVDEDRVPVVIGAYSSESTLAILPSMTRKRVPLVVPTSIADNIIEQKSPWVFRLCAGTDDYATATIDFLKNHGDPKTVAVIAEDTNFGQAAATSMVKAASEAGLSVVAEEAYNAGSASYVPLLEKVRDKHPDVVYFASYLADAGTLMRQSRQVSLGPRFFTAAGSGFSMAEFTTDKVAGKDAEHTYSAGQWSPQAKWPGAKEFAEKFAAKYKAHPPYHAVQAYVALKVVAEAMRKAKKLEPIAIRDAIRTTRMDSAFGPVAFAKNGQNLHPVLITQVQKRQHRVVWPKDVALAEPLDLLPWSAR